MKPFERYQQKQYEQGEFNLFRAERELIVKALKRTQNKTVTALRVGISVRTLHRKIYEHMIFTKEWKNMEIDPVRKKRTDAGKKHKTENTAEKQIA